MGFFDSDSPPILLKWRSKPVFICATVAVGLFTDLFLYGLVVPILPSLLRDRLDVPTEETQPYVSGLLAAYSGASVLFAIPAGYIADRTNARRSPFLTGIAALLGATIMLGLGQSLAVLVVARILQGISAAVVWTVGLAMVLDTVGPENLGKVIGSIFSFISFGSLLAPPLGGALFDKTGYVGVFGLAVGVLAVDFIMRMLVIERKIAKRWLNEDEMGSTNPRDFGSRGDEEADDDDEDDEETSLLRKERGQEFKVKDPENQSKFIKTLPVFYCLKNPRLLVALLLAFVQASLLGSFDATVPTEAEKLFNFSSLYSGLLFLALEVPNLVLGPVAGWVVDKKGVKLVAVAGFTYLVPALILLRLPTMDIVHDRTGNIVLFCAMLALNGVGLAVIGSPSVVEASDVVQKYDKQNPGFFGENGKHLSLL